MHAWALMWLCLGLLLVERAYHWNCQPGAHVLRALPAGCGMIVHQSETLGLVVVDRNTGGWVGALPGGGAAPCPGRQQGLCLGFGQCGCDARFRAAPHQRATSRPHPACRSLRLACRTPRPPRVRRAALPAAVTIGCGDVMLSFGAFPAEVPASVRFLHPLHNFSIVSYDPRRLSEEVGQGGGVAGGGRGGGGGGAGGPAASPILPTPCQTSSSAVL